MKTQVSLAADLFQFLESRSIRFVVVGDIREYKKQIRTDVDLVVEPRVLREIPEHLRDFVDWKKARLVQAIHFEQSESYFAIVWEDETGRFQYLHPDICGDYYRGGRLFLKAEEFLSERAHATTESGDDLGFYIPPPRTAFIYYLLKRVYKLNLSERTGTYLTDQWSKDPDGAARQVRRFWMPAEAARIVHAAESGDWSSLEPMALELRRKLCRKLGWRSTWLVGETGRIVQRVTQPTGISVALLGPDGSGKSAVIDRLRSELAPAFISRTRVIHLRPSFGFRRSDSGPVTEPHAKPLRGWFASLMKLGYWLFDYVAGHWMVTRIALTRSTLVLYDRYYPDILVDPVRYRYGGSLGLARSLLKLIPQPDLYVILDVPATVVLQRKAELEEKEIDRQRNEYRRLVPVLPNCHLIDGGRPLEQVTKEVVHLVFDYMESRTAHRLSLRASCSPAERV